MLLLLSTTLGDDYCTRLLELVLAARVAVVMTENKTAAVPWTLDVVASGLLARHTAAAPDDIHGRLLAADLCLLGPQSAAFDGPSGSGNLDSSGSFEDAEAATTIQYKEAFRDLVPVHWAFRLLLVVTACLLL